MPFDNSDAGEREAYERAVLKICLLLLTISCRPFRLLMRIVCEDNAFMASASRLVHRQPAARSAHIPVVSSPHGLLTASALE
jgi:hypothetical protein